MSAELNEACSFLCIDRKCCFLKVKGRKEMHAPHEGEYPVLARRQKEPHLVRNTHGLSAFSFLFHLLVNS